jgi:hypothetical protein
MLFIVVVTTLRASSIYVVVLIFPSCSICNLQRAILCIHTYIHTYHLRFIPEGVTEASHIFLRDAYILPFYLATDVTGGKPFAV